jgi:hypothetical protein
MKKKEPYPYHHQDEDESRKHFLDDSERYPKGGAKHAYKRR